MAQVFKIPVAISAFSYIFLNNTLSTRSTCITYLSNAQLKTLHLL